MSRFGAEGPGRSLGEPDSRTEASVVDTRSTRYVWGRRVAGLLEFGDG
jgi:hypothetical protein